MTPNAHERAVRVSVFSAAALLLGTASHLHSNPQQKPNTPLPAVPSRPSADFGNTGTRMLPVDELRVVTEIGRRMESVMALSKDAQTKVWASGTRDADGRLGIYVICSKPFLTPTQSPGVDARKAWLMLAVFAGVKYTGESPVTIDYIGFADPSGMGGEHWFFRLDMSTARQVQHELFANTIDLETGYERIIAAWQRVTPQSTDAH